MYNNNNKLSDECLTMGFWWEGPGMATPLLVLSAFFVSWTYTFP